MFSLVQIAQPMTLLAFVLPYLLACIFFAMTCSIFIHHRESCMMIYVFTSVPLLFISGISWPEHPFLYFGRFSHGCFRLHLESTDLYASIPWEPRSMDVKTEYAALWLQACIYFVTTCLVYRYQIMLSRRHALARLKQMTKAD